MVIHIVQKGDTVWKIAREHGVSPERILLDNGITDPLRLVVGQALIILFPEITHTVQRGESLFSIAQAYGTTEMVLLQYNPNLIAAPYLYPGQQLVIRFREEKRRDIRINGFAYPNIRQDVLTRTLPYLTYLTVFSYGFTDSGELTVVNDQPLINLAYRYRVAPVMSVSSITESGNFSSEHASMLFQNPTLQDKVLDRITEVMQQKGYLGLDIDFEYIPAADRAGYIAFVEKATEQMHRYGFFVNTDLAPKVSADQPGLLYEAHDYGAIGAASDTVMLMTYEWGYTYGPPMAVAPLDQVRRVVRYAVTEIPPGNLMLGIPNYGYDWRLPYERGVTQAVAIGNERAIEIAAQNHAEIQFSETAQSPYFEYRNGGGAEHIVWFEDIRSIEQKFALLDEFGLRGAGYWTIMRPFNQNWAFVSAAYSILKIV